MEVLDECIGVIWEHLLPSDGVFTVENPTEDLAFTRDDLYTIDEMEQFSETTISYALWYLCKCGKIEVIEPKNPRNKRLYRVAWWDIPF